MNNKSDYVKEQSRYQNTDLIAEDFDHLHFDLQLNSFVTNALFLYPLKTPEKLAIFGCF